MMDIKELDFKIFELFDKDWALVTSGPLSNHNSMTISWGGMGTLWHKNVITIYIKNVRYTYKFIEENDKVVISFFQKSYKKSLEIMGTKSGRDINKDKEANLTPIEYKGTTIYKEAALTFITHKIYHNDLDINNIPKEEINHHYLKENPHRMYILEIDEVLKNN